MIGALLEQSAVSYPKGRALVDGSRSLSFRELRDQARRIAHVLQNVGCVEGDRVALLSYNSIEFTATCFACSLGGFVAVPLNVRLGDRAICEVIDRTQPRCIIVDGRLSALAASLSTVGAWPTHALGYGDDHGQAGSLEDAMSDASAGPLPRREVDPLVLTSTSGTTGSVKLTMHSHAGVRHGIMTCLASTGFTSSSRILIAMPMYFGTGTGAYWINIASGAGAYLLPAFDAEAFVDQIEAQEITHCIVGPTPLYQVMDGGFDLHRLRSLEYLGAGGSAFDPNRFMQLHTALGGRLDKLYSTSEVNVSSVLHGHDVVDADGRFNDKVHTVGRPQPGGSIRVTDPNGLDIPNDGTTVGEVRFGGPGIGMGYWGDPELSARSFVGGELLTGDLATIDEDGFMRVVDRKSDIIVSGGINVAPIEVEGAISSHPAVRAVAVVGAPHPLWGEAVHAVVVRRPGMELTGDEVIAWAAARLPSVKKPRSVEFVEELPLSSVGKVLRRVLRDRVRQEAPQ